MVLPRVPLALRTNDCGTGCPELSRAVDRLEIVRAYVQVRAPPGEFFVFGTQG